MRRHHVESSASYRLEDRLRCRATGIGGPGSRSRARASSISFYSLGGLHVRRGRTIPGAGAEPEPQQLSRPQRSEGSSSMETVFADFISVSFIAFIFLSLLFWKCAFISRYYDLVSLFCWIYDEIVPNEWINESSFSPALARNWDLDAQWRALTIGYLARPP